jgi:hypothetical protein
MSQTTETTQVSIDQEQLNRLFEVAYGTQNVIAGSEECNKLFQMLDALEVSMTAHVDLKREKHIKNGGSGNSNIQNIPLDNKVREELITALGCKAEEILGR